MTTKPSDCCVPVSLDPAHYARHDARLRAARAAVEASRPRACPRCAGDELVPVFDVDGAMYSCEDCGHYFDGEGRAMTETRWVWDQKAMRVVEVEVISMEQPGDPMTRGLVRVGHLGLGDRDRLPADKRAAVEEARRWIRERMAELAELAAALNRLEEED